MRATLDSERERERGRETESERARVRKGEGAVVLVGGEGGRSEVKEVSRSLSFCESCSLEATE